MKIEWNPNKLLAEVGRITDENIKEGAEEIVKIAKRTVKVKTGALKDSIKADKSKYKDGGYIISAYGNMAKRDYYASFVELGTFKDQAQPFLRPALRRVKKHILNSFINKLK